MLGDHDSSIARRIITMALISAITISILSVSIGAKDREPIITEDNLVRITIRDFYEKSLFIEYRQKKLVPLKNSIEVSVKPVDAVLLLDVSSSMENYPSKEMKKGKYRIDILKRIAAQIISEASSYSKIAVVAFGAEDAPTVDFSDKYSRDLQNTIDSLEAEGYMSRAGEKLDEAIIMASSNENPCIIVLITDATEVGGGTYLFTDYIGKARREGVPVFCALINPDIDREELKEEVEETHGTLTVIGEESDIPLFTEQIEEVFGEYALKDFTMQLTPSSDVKNIAIDVTQGNVLSPQISDFTVQIAEFSPDTLILSIESTIDVEQYSEPLNIVLYSVLVTYTDPLFQEKVTLPEMETGQVYFEFEPFIEHYELYIIMSILGIMGIFGAVTVRKYNSHQKRKLAKKLVGLAKMYERNDELHKAIENLQNAVALFTQLGDPARTHKAYLKNLRKKMSELENKKERIVKILTRAQKNLKRALKILRTEQYLEEFFPSFTQLRTALNAHNITDSILATTIASIRLQNDPGALDEHLSNLRSFANESDSEFLAFGRAQNLYENENAKELITLLFGQNSCLEIDDLSKAFFEDKEVARLLLNLWKLNNPHKEGEFNEFISSEEKEGYENLANLKEMHEAISQKLDTLRKEVSTTVLEFVKEILADIGKAYELSQETLQEFSSKFEETRDPNYEPVVHTCKEIQKDLTDKRNKTESLKKSVEREIELKIGASREELEKLKKWTAKGDYRDEVVGALYKLQSELQSVGMADMLNEVHRVASDLERKMAIIGLLNNTRVMSIRNLCENLGIYCDEKGKQMVIDLCRQIINEKNRRHDAMPQYQLFTENDPEVFLDFNLLAKYTLEVGKAPAEIETDFGETLVLPREIHKDLINVLKQGKGGTHG